MKKLLLLLSIACLAPACVDDDYDLSDVETDHVTIGDGTTVLEMPLATIDVRMADFKNGEIDIEDGKTDIEALFDEVDIWLPSRLPADRDGNTAHLNIEELSGDTDYLDRLLAALIDEVRTNEAKSASLADLVWRKYRDEFLPLLPVPSTVSEAEFKEAFRTGFPTLPAVQSATRDLAGDYLLNLGIEPLRYEVGRIDLGSDVVDMLVDNLDPEGTPDAKNKLILYGEADNSLPVSFGIRPIFENTAVTFSVAVAFAADTPLPETRIYANDLRAIIAGTYIDIPVTLLRYDPGQGFAPDQSIRFTLCLRKTGGLKLDL